MSLPAVWNLPKHIADHEHVMGPLIVSMAVIYISESTRSVRYVNVLVGCWLLIAPWVLHHHELRVKLTEAGAGLLLPGCSLAGGKRKNQFGGGWRSLFSQTPDHFVSGKSVAKN